MDRVLSIWALPLQSVNCLDALWPKWIPTGQKAIRSPGTRNTLATQLWTQGKKEDALFHLSQPS